MINRVKEGLLCAPLDLEIANRLDIPLMTNKSSDRQGSLSSLCL